MHPVIRIVTCICLIGVIVRAQQPLLLSTFLVLLVSALLTRRNALSATLVIAWRLKWLFLSILLLYLWMTPGEPIISIGTNDANWLPSKQGMVLATQRIVVLLLIILCVQLLILGVNRDQLVAAITWLLYPLSRAGFPTQSFAVRCALTVHELQHIRESIGQTLGSTTAESRIARAVSVIAFSYRNALDVNSQNESITVSVDSLERPSLLQWVIPLAVLGLAYLAGMTGVVA